MEKICRKCKEMCVPKPYQLKRRDYICSVCDKEERMAWRKKRLENGLWAYGSRKRDPKKQKEYYQRPDVKKKRAARARKRSKNPKQRIKDFARWYLNRKKSKGEIKSEPCVFCNEPLTQAHHPDYSKPLAVMWFCRKCHEKLHEKKNPNDWKYCDSKHTRGE